MDSPARRQGFVLDGEVTPLGLLLDELWDCRELIAVLARKDFYVRYRRASLGLMWAVGLPLFQAVVLAVVFSKVVRVHTGTNLTIFVLIGMVPWTYFSTTLTSASTSIVDGAGLSGRIYFPRVVLPLVGVVANLYGYAITLAITLLLCPFFGVGLGLHTLWMVPATALAIAVTTGTVMVTSALHVYFRDVRYIVTAAVIGWFYLTPIFYPLRLAHGVLRTIIVINPLTGVVELMRRSTAGADPGWTATGTAVVWAIVLVGIGLGLHRRFNRVFTDLQ